VVLVPFAERHLPDGIVAVGFMAPRVNDKEVNPVVKLTESGV